MKIARLPKRRSVIAAFMVMLSFIFSLRGYAVTEDNPQLTDLVADADDEAIELANDAGDTQGLIRSDENWVNHALIATFVKYKESKRRETDRVLPQSAKELNRGGAGDGQNTYFDIRDVGPAFQMEDLIAL